MRIQVPNRIEIGGKTFTVRVEPQSGFENNRQAGQCDFDKQHILIRRSHAEAQSVTFLHEWMEGVNDVWLNGSLEHSEINAIGEAMLQLFKQLGAELDWIGDSAADLIAQATPGNNGKRG